MGEQFLSRIFFMLSNHLYTGMSTTMRHAFLAIDRHDNNNLLTILNTYL